MTGNPIWPIWLRLSSMSSPRTGRVGYDWRRRCAGDLPRSADMLHKVTLQLVTVRVKHFSWPRSELLDACRADRRTHFRGLAADQFLQIFGRALVARGHVRDDILEPLVHPWRVEGGRKRCIEPADDRLGRILWEEQAEPGADVEIRQALFPSAGQVRNLRRALGLQNGDPFDRVGVDQGLARRAQGADVIVAAGDQVLHRRAAAAIRHMRYILDAERRVEQFAKQVAG